jgi:hypothetical protein
MCSHVRGESIVGERCLEIDQEVLLYYSLFLCFMGISPFQLRLLDIITRLAEEALVL